MVRESMDLPAADLLWIDEAHHCPAETYQKIIDAYPDAILLGITATPCRGDGRGLGGIFETIIETPQVAELIEQGYLVKTRVYAPVDPDLKGVETRSGDYVESQLAERMDRDHLVGDIVTHWHKYGERRKTVCFAVSVGHSVHIRDEFLKSGVRAEHIDGSTPKDERDATLKRLESGADRAGHQLHGADRRLGHAGMRLHHPGAADQKDGAVSPDGRPRAAAGRRQARRHRARSFRRHFPARLRRGSHRMDARSRQALDQRRAYQAPRWRPCLAHPGMQAMRRRPRRRRACFHCGYLPAPPPRLVEFEDGDLGLLDRDRRAKPTVFDPAERARWHAMLAHIGLERGYKPGWTAHKYKEKFGAFPPWGASPAADSADARSPIVGSLAPDRFRQAEQRMKKRKTSANKIDCGFTRLPHEMRWSPAWRVLSLAARRVLDLLELELGKHRGKNNGRICVTYADFQRYGIGYNNIAPALRELEVLGFIRIRTRPRR